MSSHSIILPEAGVAPEIVPTETVVPEIAIESNICAPQSVADMFRHADLRDKGALWSIKHSPENSKMVMGNEDNINKLKSWLMDWDENCLDGKKKNNKAVKVSKPMNSRAEQQPDKRVLKSALISGPPGIGKTTTVKLVAKEFGYSLIELNASDTRSKAVLKDLLRESLSNTSISAAGGLGRNLILMDEVDGLTSDRGGTHTLNDFIKKSKNPIICVCNDRSSQKLKALINNCYDLIWKAPEKDKVVLRLKQILETEGKHVLDADLDHLVTAFRSDMRQILDFLGVWFLSHESFTATEFDAQGAQAYRKDRTVAFSTFNAAAVFLNPREFGKYNMRDLMNLFFVDTGMVPQIVRESYLRSDQKEGYCAKPDDLRQVLRAADSIARSDQISGKMYKLGDFKLLDCVGFLGTLNPCRILKPNSQAGFPTFFGKTSALRKHIREMGEFKTAICSKVSGNREAIRTDYAPAIVGILYYYLAQATPESVKLSLKFWEYYDLKPQLVGEHLQDLIYNPEKEKLLGGIQNDTMRSMHKVYQNKHSESIKTKKRIRVGKNFKFDEHTEQMVESEEEDYWDDDDNESDDFDDYEVDNKQAKWRKK